MMQLDAIPVAHTLEFLENELWSIVCDNCFRNTKSCNDVGLDKLDHCGGFDFGEGFSFSPFSVILVVVRMKDFRFGASVPVLDSGPTTSNAHIEKGHGEESGWREDVGAWILSA